MKKSMVRSSIAFLLVVIALHQSALGQVVINDTLTGAASTYDWKALNGACLTAGNNTGPIPACVGLTYYGGAKQVGGTSGLLPDAVGKGALRLTNGDVKTDGSNGDNQTGAVVGTKTFPTTQGVQVTFTTVTYGGDNLNGHGADGISFFLMDGARDPSVGGLGGSLGYSCSNGNGVFDGVTGGYIGIGIDEYGNFSNPGDTTDTGPGFKAGRISVRGAGDTAWVSLNSKYKRYYPDNIANGNKGPAVRNTCRTGYLWNYSGGTLRDATGKNIADQSQTNEKLTYNYPLISYSDLPNSVSIANQQGIAKPLRGDAIPITYALKITQDGLLDLSYSVNGGAAQPVIAKQKITASNGPLPASFRFGFSAGTGGGSNVHEITCFKAAQVDESSSSAGTNVQQSAQVEAGAQLYLAYFHETNWWGQMTAQNLVYTEATDTVSIAPVANWDASCVLTGGDCASTTKTTTAQAPGNRTILSWNGTTGIPFQWSNLTTAQKSTLNAGDSSSTDARLLYLRGNRSDELSNSGGKFRTRSGVLGDLINSSPTWVGPPTSPYEAKWIDALYPSTTMAEKSYTAFKTDYATRQNLVYVGANDGMMHGFKAGAYDANGNFVGKSSSTPNDGTEGLAYMPAASLASIHSTTPALDFSGTQYAHNFFADATPGTGDLYYSGAWHTWLVSGMGAGGNPNGPVGDTTSSSKGSLFALDITDPSKFSESSAAALVVGEWSTDTISCTNTLVSCDRYLGSTYGTPAIRRLHNGNWGVIFGNGLNSSNGTAGIFIMLVSSTGTTSFRYIDTKSGPLNNLLKLGAKNGIAYVNPTDLDGDHITDYVYAGDAYGNVWRFDLTSQDPASWSVSTTPMFSTPSGQPITSKVAVGSILGNGKGARPRIIVAFGTGQQLPQTLTSASAYSKTSQALYGVWDWNMSAWNKNAGGTAQYEVVATNPGTLGSSDLQAQTVTSTISGSGNISGYRTISREKICWSGSTACTAAADNNKFGWRLALPSTNEQVVYNPVLSFGMFIVNTTIPGASSALTCDIQPDSGYTMAVTLAGGGAASQSFFGDTNNVFVSYAGGIVSGIGLGATGTPSIVTSKKKPYLVQQTVSGDGVVTQVNPGVAGTGGRLNWIKLR